MTWSTLRGSSLPKTPENRAFSVWWSCKPSETWALLISDTRKRCTSTIGRRIPERQEEKHHRFRHDRVNWGRHSGPPRTWSRTNTSRCGTHPYRNSRQCTRHKLTSEVNVGSSQCQSEPCEQQHTNESHQLARRKHTL